MRIRPSTALLSLAAAIALGAAAPDASHADEGPALMQVQYDRYPDDRRGYDPRGGYYPPPPRADYPYPRDPYAGREFPRWRPGDVVPPEVFDYVVHDWEPRGLERPPGGHQWVRVDPQFLLVRERDRMISRVINFD